MLSTTDGVRSKTYLAKRWLIAIIFATLVFAGILAAVSYNSQKALADNNSASAAATQISITNSSTGYTTGTSTTLERSVYHSGDEVVVKWKGATAGERNLVVPTAIKVDGVTKVTIAALNKIDSVQEANSEYERRMGSAGTMTTYDKLKAYVTQEHSVSVGKLTTDSTVEVVYACVSPVYRLYNIATSEHLFSTNKTEYDNFVALCKQDQDFWIGEGIDWLAPYKAEGSYTAVHRLYNPALGAMGHSSHYYTSDATEMANLIANHGWRDDGVDNQFISGGDTAIYTCYNEALGSAHHYTSSKTEWSGLSAHGWALEEDKNGTNPAKTPEGAFQCVMGSSFSFSPNYYTVEHQLENADGSFTTTETQFVSGTAGQTTNATANAYVGYTAKAFNNTSISANNNSNVIIQYTRNEYTLTYDSNQVAAAQNLPTAQKAKYGTSVTAATTSPTAEGKVFEGWFLDASGSVAFSNLTMPAGDVTVYAKWSNQNVDPTREYIDVNLIMNREGVDDRTIAHEKGTVFNEPDAPAVVGWTFRGWYADIDLATEYEFGLPLSETVTLYAKWTRYESTTTDSNGQGVVEDPSKGDGTMLNVLVEYDHDNNEGTAQLPLEGAVVEPNEDGTVYVILPVDADGHLVRVTIKDSNDKGVAGKLVTAVNSDKTVRKANEATDANGIALFPATVSITDDKGNASVTDNSTGTSRKLNVEVTYRASDDSQDLVSLAGAKVELGANNQIRVYVPQSADEKTVSVKAYYVEADSGIRTTKKVEVYDHDYLLNMVPRGGSGKSINPDRSNNTATFAYYIVNFDTEGVGRVDAQRVYEGTSAVAPEAPVKNDAQFLGWFDDAEGTTAYNFKTYVSEDRTIYGKYKTNEYTITYYLDDLFYRSDKVLAGDIAVEPAIPTRAGFTFDAWYTDQTLTTKYDYSTSVKENISLYGNWTANTTTKYTVVHVYEALSGIAADAERVSIESTGTTNTAVDITPVEKVGFTHSGGANKVVVLPDGSGSAEITYSRVKNNIVFNGGDKATSIEPATQSNVKFGDKLTEPTVQVKDGYVLVGWYTDAELTKPWDFATDTMPETELNLHAKVSAKTNITYTVKHVYEALEGGVAEEVSETLNGATDQLTDAKAKDKEGFSAPEQIDNVAIAADGSTVVTINYTRNSYDVTFSNGGYGASPTSPVAYKYGAKIAQPDLGTVDGRKLLYWNYVDGNGNEGTWNFETGTLPSTTLSLTAKWGNEDDITYTVIHKFEKVDGDGWDEERVLLIGQTDGTTAAVAYTRTGFTAQEPIAQQTIKGDGSTEVSVEYKRNVHTLKINAGDHGTVTNLPEESQKFGKVVSEPTVTPNDGYIFDKWTYVDAQGNIQTFDFSKGMPDSDIELIANWKAATDTEFTINYYEMDTEGNYPADDKPTNTTKSYGQTEAQTAVTAPEKVGFEAKDIAQQTILGDGTTVVKVYYERLKFGVTFLTSYATWNWERHGSVTPESQAVYYGAKVTLPTATADDGWQLNNSSTSGYFNFKTMTAWNFDTDTMPAEALELVASWTGRGDTKYTVIHKKESFVDGDYPHTDWTKEEKYGTTGEKTAAAPFTAESAGFVGFTPQTITQVTIAGDGSTEVEILYKRNTWNVEWDLAGGTGEDTTRYGVKFGSLLVAPKTPVKAGYDFAGWKYYEGTVLKEWSFDTNTVPNNDFKIFADWTARSDTSYTIKHYFQNLEQTAYVEDETIRENLTGQTGQYITADVKMIDGFTRVTGGDEVISGYIQADGSLELRVYYKRNHYNVVLDSGNQGEWKETRNLVFGSKVERPQVSQSGWTCRDWTYTVGGVTKIWDFEKDTVPAGGVTLMARWEPNEGIQYKVVHKQQSLESDDTFTEVETETLKGTAGEQTNAVAKNYTGFTADSVTNVAIDGAGTTTVEIKYFRNTRTITLNTGDNAVATPNKFENVKYGSSISFTTSVETGYELEGWYTDANYINKIEDVTKYTVPDADTQLYAKVVAKSDVTYVVKYELQDLDNDANYTEDETKRQTLKGTTGTVAAATAFQITGFKAQAVPSEIVKGDGTTVVTIKYTRNKHTVTFNAGDGATVTPVGYSEVKFGSLIDVPTATRAGYDLDGWYQDLKDETTKWDFKTSTMDDINVTLYAKWTVHNDTLYQIKHSFETLTTGVYEVDESKTQSLYGAVDDAITVDAVRGYAKDIESKVAGFAYDETSYPTVQYVGAKTTTVVTLKYKRLSYSIDFVGGDKGTFNPNTRSNVKYGAKVTEPIVLANAGYHFDGWYSDEALASSIDLSTWTMPAANTKIYAKFSSNTDTEYTVLHKRESLTDGDYPETLVYKETKTGTTDAETAATALTSEDFAGWTADQTSITKDTIKGDKSTTVEIKYTRNKYDITYSAGDQGESVSKTSDSAKFESTLEAPTAKEKLGYHLVGWKWSDENGNSGDWDFATSTVPAKKITITAQWAGNEGTAYKVEHYQQKVDASGYDKVADGDTAGTGVTGEQTDPAPQSYTGFKYEKTENVAITGDGNAVAKVYYNRIAYNITINNEDTTAGTVDATPTGATALYGAKLTKPTTTANPGYTFSKFVDQDGKDWDFENSVVSDKDITLTAKWVKNGNTAYQVKHWYEGTTEGETYPESSMEKVDMTGETESTTKAEEKAKTGFTVVSGWTQDTIKGDGSTVINIYYTRNVHTVTFDGGTLLGGQTKVEVTPTSQTVKFDTLVPEPNIAQRAGYTLDGWYTEKNGAGTKWEWATSKIEDKDFTLYAKWTAQQVSYTIAYHYPNIGGEGETVEYVTGKTAAADSIITADRKDKEGFTVDQKTLTGLVQGDGNTTVNVKYTRNSYKVTLKYNDEKTTTKEETKEFGEKITDPNATREGYKLNGWKYTDKDNTERYWDFTNGTVPAYDLTLTADWSGESQTYTVKHQQQNADNDEYTDVLTETKYGKTGDQTTAVANVYEGFTAPITVDNKQIEANNATVIEIKYTRNKYDVNFVAGDNATMTNGDKRTVKWGTKLDTLPTVTAKDGYETDSVWYRDLDYTTQWNAETDTVPVGGITFYKKVVAKTNTQYKVKHLYQNINDDQYKEHKVEELTGTTGLMTEAKALTDEGFTTPVIVNKPIAGDGTTVIELKYDRKKFTVTFRDGTDNTEYLDRALSNVKFGATINKPADPTKTGGEYRFDGWFQEQEYTNAWVFAGESNATTMPANNVVLYAKFYDLNDTSYTVIHKYEAINTSTGATTGWDEERENLKGQSGKQTNAQLKTKDGFTPTSSTVTQTTVKSDGTSTVTIEYTRNSYNMFFKNGDHGTVLLGQKIFKYGQITKTTDAYANTGWTLAKWVDQNGSDWVEGTPMPAYTVTLTAHYKLRDDVPYTVVHKREGLTDGTWIEETTTQYGTTGTTTNATPITSGDYAGFNVENTTSATISGNGSTKVEITYKRKEHNVTLTGYDTYGKMTKTTFKQKYGTTIERPKFDSTNAGWSVESWKYNNAVWNFDTNLMPNNDITLTAEWSTTRFKVHFKTDKINIVSGKTGTYSFTGTDNKVPAELDGLTNSAGYKSKYWCQNTDGTGTQYKPGDKLDFNFDYQDQEVTLWAIWNTDNLDFSKFTVDQSDKVYSNTQQRPTVTSNGYKLNTDYKLSFGENKNAGKGTVTVIGLGYYKGEKTYEFNITQKPVEVSGITAKSRTYIEGNTTAELDLSKVVISGKIDGTDVGVSAKGSFADDKVADNKTVTISDVTLVGGDAANYKVSKAQTTTTASITGTYYNVYFHGNGSNNGMADYRQKRNTADTGEGYDRLLACSFAKTSGSNVYGFKYWTTNADGTGDRYEDKYQGHITTRNDNQDVHLYAQWTSTPLGGFWFAKSKTITKDNTSSAGASNPTYNKPEYSVLWTQSEVESNVNMLISQISRGWTYDTNGGYETNYIKVFTDMMKSDEYHLYTKRNGYNRGSELDYVEFRVIQVGQHDGDGTSLTFQSTHAMEQQRQIYDGDMFSGTDNNVNWMGWYSTDLHYWHLANGTGMYYTQFNGGLNNWNLIKNVPKSYDVGNMGVSTTSTKYWVMSPSELTDVTGAKGSNGVSWEASLRKEGSQYSYWKDVIGAKYQSANPAVVANGKKRDGSSTRGNLTETKHHTNVFWLRDAYRGQSFSFQYQETYFATTQMDGSANGGSDRYDSRGVVICFAVGL